jgi:diketogulonate reductase-like aldo/keto reductase
MEKTMNTVALPCGPGGTHVPALGLGTWRFGENARMADTETEALIEAIRLGYRLIDTAELYGDGGAERVVGRVLAAATKAALVRREDMFIVSKVLPNNASRRGVAAACRASLKRLGVDFLDLYLLHWRGGTPLAETVGAFEQLRAEGLIRHWGVSNFDVDDLTELAALPAGAHCVVNQVYYSASQRGIEFDLLPWQRERRMATMAYSPIDQGALAGHRALAAIGGRHGVTAAQAALAWVLRQPDVIAIPKAGSAEHLRANLSAAALKLDAQDLAAIDAAFPPPRRKRPLAMT